MHVVRLLVLTGLLFAATPALGQRAVGRESQPAEQQAAGRRSAFLVGINDYVHQPKLRFCRQDVQAMRDLLVQHGRFDARDIVTLADGGTAAQSPTFAGILTRLPQVLRLAGPKDVVVVFMAGHGVQFEDARNKQAYFIPIDGADRQTSISLAWLREQLDACKARSKVLILDACRNDSLDGRSGRKMGSTLVSDLTSDSFLTLFSCEPGQVSNEMPDLGHGVFTHYLLEGLRGKADRDGDKQVDLGEVHRYARLEVQRWGLQAGREQGPMIEGRLADPIVLTFVDRVGAAPPPPSEAPSPPRELVLDLGGGEKLDLVLIPAGRFQMGSPESEAGHTSDEYQHWVRISRAFYMGKYEVTQGQWRAVMGSNPSGFKECGDDCPVENVSWEDAREFCRRLSARAGREIRLPTEAEWEYACRAGSTTPFHLGETISTGQANYDGDQTYGNGSKGVYREKPVRVGSFSPNGFGLYDMHGNVLEWCRDWYEADYYKSSPEADPAGPGSGSDRVLRGGSWANSPWSCRSAIRFTNTPGYRYNLIGFRISSGTP